ncbi:MAG: ribonuclease P protein component [Candidatus Abawacabacteria bacterium RIFCSPHIGHO2_01_FULL_46_8]|uniref:Ribonuclease P protein component n=1 Tax=Candidatus Abawacabacteria bacterium RIFCSPHIGHO2_01_FULL_46_8 TaxID=1817815 RepID=A0A1F4XN25_9BACT|nr:MAG: ribonuclease P protein component [Candidatus Abawacabacteria bacterium RIFCSPHIGHO2_01_FULL_46_8]
MFPRWQRLVTSEEIRHILARGKKLRGKYLQLSYWLRSEQDQLSGSRLFGPRFTVVVGLKQAKKAVERNRLKRRYRALAAKHQARWPQRADLVLLPYKEALTADFADLEKDYLTLLPQ